MKPSQPRASRPRHLMIMASVACMLAVTATSVAAALPAEKSSHGAAYVSGGIGLDESTALKAARADFPLTVEIFATADGRNEYTAAVPLTITRPGGEVVFDSMTEGPYTLIKLPPGSYVVKATHGGKAQARQVRIGAQGGARASFVF